MSRAPSVTAGPAPSAALSVRRHWIGHVSPNMWAAADVVLVALVAWGAYGLLVYGGGGFTWVAGPWLSILTFAGCIPLAGLVFGLYEPTTLTARSRILVRTSLAALLGTVLAYAAIVVGFYHTTSRWLGALVLLLYAATALPLRLLAHAGLTCTRWRVLCVGCDRSVRELVALLRRSQRPHVRVVGHVVTARPAGPVAGNRFVTEEEREFADACPCLGSIRDLDALLVRYGVDEVVLGAQCRSDPAIDRAILTCLERHCRVTDQPTFVEKLLGQVPVGDISARWFVLADVQGRVGYAVAKRVLDATAAAAGLLLTLPLWALIAVAIRLERSGPVLFRQRRVGLHGREFTMVKFRTMRVDAESRGPRWAAEHDERVTRVGRLLRRSRLDELPQLWNILKGEMSLVGPRPERPEFVGHLGRLIPHYRQRHLIKPGLTGWAQIHCGYGGSVADAHHKLCFDLYYLKNRSLELDLAILIRTLGTFLLGAR